MEDELFLWVEFETLSRHWAKVFCTELEKVQDPRNVLAKLTYLPLLTQAPLIRLDALEQSSQLSWDQFPCYHGQFQTRSSQQRSWKENGNFL